MDVGLTLITFLLSLVICLVLMPPFIRLMERYKILDKAGGRKIHKGYTAHMGGIVIFIAVVLSTVVMMLLYDSKVSHIRMMYIGVVLLVMLIVGVRDDMHNISPYSKLFFEILVSIFMSYIGIRLDSFGGFLGIYEIPVWISYGITICFFIVVVNSYNLIDGIDGQAGMQAINVFLFCFLFYWLIMARKDFGPDVVSTVFMYISSLAILGAILGFLKYNWQKAKIFMGDAGSLLIGTLITIFIIVSTKHAMLYNVSDGINNMNGCMLGNMNLKATIAPFLSIFYLPMADTLRVFLNRIRHGKSPFHPDKTHIHHLFIRIGFSHQKCTLITFAISLGISILGFILAFLFNDNVCIPVVIISWFAYVKVLHIIVNRMIEKGSILKNQCDKIK